ncbi:MAG: MATE family efflux transporter [Blautia sp.]|jgi:putative MATE family efflux protein
MEQNNKLGTEPIGKLMVQMAMPAVAAQIINMLYNIVDRMYIGHIADVGHLALTGVGVTFPILMLISAFSAFAGMGGAPLASISLGKKDMEGAERILGNSVLLLLSFAVILTTVFQIFKTPLLFFFGASEQSIGYGVDYISIYLWGTVFVELAVGLNTFISGQGNAKVAMYSVLIGAIINIILDPILIFGFHMGVQGAAIATVFSQAMSAAWVLRFLSSSKAVLRIRKEYLRFNGAIVKQIAFLGVSPFVMQSTESLVNIVLNSGLQRYGGDMYVGTMTILSSVMQLFVMPIQGITQGVQPIISFNYGAGNIPRVKKAFRLMLFVCLGLTVCCGLSAMFIPQVYAGFFTNDAQLRGLVGQVMPIFFMGITVFGIQMACQSTFLALGQAKVSVFLAVLRKVILLIPLALILPRFFGVMGIYYAEPVADVTAVITTAVMFLLQYKTILAKVPA